MADERLLDLFAFQQRALSILLGWGLGTATVGAYWRRAASPLARSFATHFAGWGVFSALLGAGGLAIVAWSRRRCFAEGLNSNTYSRYVHYTQLILKASVALDLLYAMYGVLYLQRRSARIAQRGMARAVIIHGYFFLSYDVTHLFLLRRKIPAHESHDYAIMAPK